MLIISQEVVIAAQIAAKEILAMELNKKDTEERKAAALEGILMALCGLGLRFDDFIEMYKIVVSKAWPVAW